MGLVATLAALVLGLLIASAKNSYDAQSTEVTEMSAKVVFLDRVLAHYGPETKQAREVLRSAVVRVLDQMWSKDRTSPSQLEPTSAGTEVLADKIQELSPKDDTQRSLQAQSMSIVMVIGQTRWLMMSPATHSFDSEFFQEAHKPLHGSGGFDPPPHRPWKVRINVSHICRVNTAQSTRAVGGGYRPRSLTATVRNDMLRAPRTLRTDSATSGQIAIAEAP
jgi:hypothetical protein